MSRSTKVAVRLCGTLLLAACGDNHETSSNQPPPPPPPPASPPAALRFIDATAASGIAFENRWQILYQPTITDFFVGEFANSGAAAGDYDNDGDIDLFITRGDLGPNLLYRNNGSGVFTDVAAAAGLAFAAGSGQNYRLGSPTFADMDGDGDLDIFIGGLFGDRSFIFANNGDGTFSDVTVGSGIDRMKARHSVAAAFGDYDLDGDLDMFVTHWGSTGLTSDESAMAVGETPIDFGDTEHLWQNISSNGKIVFKSVSEPAGISPSIFTFPDPLRARPDGDWTFTPTFARINSDLYPEILLTADFNRSQVFTNNANGTFSNTTDPDVLTDGNGMGSTLGDFDNDGDLDWFVTSIMWPDNPNSGNRLYRNENGSFADVTEWFGVRDGGWGWGACFLDLQNDGFLDIYNTNGWAAEGDFKFDVTRAYAGSGGGPFVRSATKMGLNDNEQGRGVVCADFDNDGDVDIFQLHRGSPVAATMWRNDTSNYNSLAVKLIGLAPNTEAAGARIYVKVGTTTQMREIMIGNNFLSQNPTVQIFGLGAATEVDQVTVEWPNGIRTTQGPVAARQKLILRQPGL